MSELSSISGLQKTQVLNLLTSRVELFMSQLSFGPNLFGLNILGQYFLIQCSKGSGSTLLHPNQVQNKQATKIYEKQISDIGG